MFCALLLAVRTAFKLDDGAAGRPFSTVLNPLNAQLNPICHLLALLGAHHILHVSRIRVKNQLRKSAIDGISAVMNCAVSLTNQELQVYFEHLRTVRDIFVKEQQQKSFQAKLVSFFEPEL